MNPMTKKQKKNERILIVYMHESGVNIGIRMNTFKQIVKEANYSILSIANRGYSDSDDNLPDESGLYKDANAIAKFLKNPKKSNHPELAKYIDKDLIFGFGRGFGGTSVIYMA